jgi:hypothetical protein
MTSPVDRPSSGKRGVSVKAYGASHYGLGGHAAQNIC